MTVYASTTCLADGTPVTEVVATLAASGIDHIELGSTHPPQAGLEAALANIDATFITHNFFPPSADGLVLNLAAGDPGTRTATVQFMRGAIDFAANIGAAVYTIHPGFAADALATGTRGTRNFDFEFAQAHNPRAFDHFLQGYEQLLDHAAGSGVAVALETQGSVTSDVPILLTRLEEFAGLIDRFGTDCAINLNLAHSAFAAERFDYALTDLLTLIDGHVAAVEVSHNDGTGDQHLALEDDAGYLDILRSHRFADAAIIFEGRDVGLPATLASIDRLRAACPA